MDGSILQIQNFSVNDGDGIRTTIFLAGCPLRCQWCANPEGFTIEEKVAYYARNCIGCGKCEAVCPQKIKIDLNRQRKKCISCGKCVEVCPKSARKFLTWKQSEEEIVAQIKPQIPFYRKSGGGVTFSGGEATIQQNFLRKLANRFYDMGIDLALETCGYFDFDQVKDILELMDLIFIDIKHMDSKEHKKFTGKGNEIILQNITRMREVEAKVVVRIPVIVGVNSQVENIQATAQFVHRNLPKAKIELLPYHCYGEAKYEALGLLLPSQDFQIPSEETIEKLENLIQENGVETVRFR